MPVSGVIEIHREKKTSEEPSKVRFSSEDVLLEIPVDLDRTLGSPDIMRIRVEDTWNDPERKWNAQKTL